MSGNMSSLDPNRTSKRTVLSTGTEASSGNNRPPRQVLEEFSPISITADEDISFNTTSTPSVLNGADKKLDSQYSDKDVWGTRILLSALADISFTQKPFPKLSPQFIQALQKLILCINAAASRSNPFVEFAGRNCTPSPPSMDSTAGAGAGGDDSSHCHFHSGSDAVDISTEILEELEKTPVETKIVVRSLVGTYVRNTLSKIIHKWKPILELNGVKLPSPSGNKGKQQPGQISIDEKDLQESFELILKEMKNIQTGSLELDAELREAMEKRDEEVAKFERDCQKYNETTLAVLKEKIKHEEQDFMSSYQEYLDLEMKCTTEGLRLEKLKQATEGISEHEQKEIQELYKNLRVGYETMERETKELQERISQYKDLGGDLEKIVQQYSTFEEEIKMKEWVKEQLQNGPKDDSLLFSDSFND